NINFLINPSDRIGLVGDNGSGKTTLLKLIAGQMKPESGEIIIPSDKKIGYLPQEIKTVYNLSVIDETQKAYDEINQLALEIDELNEALLEREDYSSPGYMKLVDKLSHATEHFQILGGENKEAETEKILKGLGFLQDDFQRPLNEFSGGWRMRVEIAKLLLRKPDILLLDEPVNHLDIESIEWLEEFLKTYPGAVLLVAHDRTFLDNVTSRTIEITKGKVYDYKMNYSRYVHEREARLIGEQAAFTNQQKQIQQTERFIERFRYKATKSKQVKSKQKELNKLDRVEIDNIDRSAIHFKFQEAPPSGKIVIETKELNKSYDQNHVLSNLDFVALKGEKIAFVGKNGMGKSTLSKIIVKEIDYTGEFKLGFNVSMGYYAQNQTDLLDYSKTVFETIDDVATGEIRKKIRDILGSFLFSGEDIDKPVKVLSGGEKSRLALAKMLLKPYNLLVLDEPTNHLDLKSKDILKTALINFTGTLIIVSHDRDFLSGLTTKVIEFKKSETKTHLGDVGDFLAKRKIEKLGDLNKNTSSNSASNTKEASQNKLDYHQRKENEKAKRKIQNRIDKLEIEIADLESAIEIKDMQLSQPDDHQDLINEVFFEKYKSLKKQLQLKMEAWEIAAVELEA
ncbi:MAG: ATP-binding cassette domain-containing protein, partial [Bacteroidales bacterium]|nr:ATP-binding cassette domain-containing protein [Bacteroidales bacterium]